MTGKWTTQEARDYAKVVGCIRNGHIKLANVSANTHNGCAHLRTSDGTEQDVSWVDVARALNGQGSISLDGSTVCIAGCAAEVARRFLGEEA